MATARTEEEQALAGLRERAIAELATIATAEGLDEWRTRFLGRERGELTGILKGLGKLPGEQRKAVGQAANTVKNELEGLLEQRKAALKAAEQSGALERERLDVTLPGRMTPRGHIHPISQTIRDIGRIFSQMGFQVYDGPEVETDYYNFQALNIPQDHPARDMQDTFWIVPGQILLRTQTSNNQIRIMEQMQPPVRAIVPGRVYRNEAIDASHEAAFHQVEGLLIDETCTMSDLRGVVERFAREMFGAERKVRFRPSYFPFTEPSAEFDMDCINCDGAGCRVCKYSGWLEMGGSGMVHPKVLRGVGYDPATYRGFAFGLGIERIAMLRYGVDDIRLFSGNDLRFLRQFA
ncbi:MAG: Phenylalanyl-tRNA synthetase alpha chain [Ktedonobacterales bacterium]|nr:MAG: Phenylalanyl-tRNA synthetase alpha chain [Ktedonobacterales bacterium]